MRGAPRASGSSAGSAWARPAACWSSEFHVPTIGYGPGSEDLAHASTNTWRSAKITEAVYGTAAIVHGLIGIPVFGWTSDEI